MGKLRQRFSSRLDLWRPVTPPPSACRNESGSSLTLWREAMVCLPPRVFVSELRRHRVRGRIPVYRCAMLPPDEAGARQGRYRRVNRPGSVLSRRAPTVPLAFVRTTTASYRVSSSAKDSRRFGGWLVITMGR